MDDPLGFLHHDREEPPKEAPERRLRHWREYVARLSGARAGRQAGRCMDCGIPFCHARCPVHNLIPEWNLAIAEGRWREAYAHLESTNNFPEFTGRLCPAPCEHACTLRRNGAPVVIREIERALSERAWAEGWVRPLRARRRRLPIAVVGSGPAGLACAQQLQRAGYRVSLYEKADRPGGLLRYGIPDFRLPKAVLDRRLEQMRTEGVVFRTGEEVNGGADLERIRGDHAALVLACGCEQPRDVAVAGRSLAGIHFALDYLRQQNRRLAGDTIPPDTAIHARGLDVVVIGGGDTGGDCVGTALRQGARSVTQIQYHERPPEAVEVLDHWPEPSPEYRPTDHDDEGCTHLWGWDTLAFEGHGGRVRAVSLRRLAWVPDRQGRLRKHHLPGPCRRLPAGLVLIAIGYAHPRHEGLIQALGLDLGARGTVAANDRDYRSSAPGVFACGDMRRGQSLIVWAIREGRQCAEAVDRWLSGDSDLPRV